MYPDRILGGGEGGKKLEGKALGIIVQLVAKGEGLEAWRQLKLEYEGKSGNRQAALLREDISDGILAATVLEHSPGSYQNIPTQAPSNVRASYSAMRGWLREYAETLRRYDGTSGTSAVQPQSIGPVPMEVDQTRAVLSFSSGKDGKGKSKGEGKSKDGKGKGKGKKGEKARIRNHKPRLNSCKDTVDTARSGDVPTAENASPMASRRVVRQQPLLTMTVMLQL